MEKLHFECPNCQHPHAVPVSKIGKKAKCSKCKARLVVPDDGSKEELAIRRQNEKADKKASLKARMDQWTASELHHGQKLDKIADNTARTAGWATAIGVIVVVSLVLQIVGCVAIAGGR